jgi:Dehydrogenases with different specificities (related to short-chain alcohol dehydrogenases)
MNNTQSPFKSDCLKGKVALVTGGGSGICYAITQQLLLHGCSAAVILGRRLSFLQSAAETLSASGSSSSSNKIHPTQRVLYQVCDVRDPNKCMEAVKYTVEQCGRLDILVNGAAGNFLAQAKNLKPKGFKTVVDIDAIGTFNMCYAAYGALKESKGCVINISATLQYGATWYQVHASAAKSAVDSLTRTLALEWGSDGIRINGIAPGPIANTPGMAKLAPTDMSGDSSFLEEMIAEGIPLGRLGKGFDIGMAAVFLSCDTSGSYITGHTMVVDGGEWLYRPPMVEKELVESLSRSVEKQSRDMRPTNQHDVTRGQVIRSKL